MVYRSQRHQLFKSWSCLRWLLLIMLVLLKFFCQIISVDMKLLVTSFNISEVAFQTSGFQHPWHEPWSHCLSVPDESPVSRGFAPPAWLLSASGPEFFTKCFLVKYSFLKVHLKLPGVILQILVIHRLRLKVHPLPTDAPSAFYHPILPCICMLNSTRWQ